MSKAKTVIDEVLDDVKPGPVKSIAQALIDELSPRDAQGNPVTKDNSFKVRIMSQWAQFRFPKNSGDIHAIKTGMLDFLFRIKEMQAKVKAGKPDCPQPYIDALSIRDFDDQDICNAYIIYYWSHPDQYGGRFTEPQVLTMVALNPSLMSQVVDRIDGAINEGAIVFAFGGVSEKKAS